MRSLASVLKHTASGVITALVGAALLATCAPAPAASAVRRAASAPHTTAPAAR